MNDARADGIIDRLCTLWPSPAAPEATRKAWAAFLRPYAYESAQSRIDQLIRIDDRRPSMAKLMSGLEADAGVTLPRADRYPPNVGDEDESYTLNGYTYVKATKRERQRYLAGENLRAFGPERKDK